MEPLALLLGKCEELVREHGSASALRDLVALVREQAKLVVEENEKLKARVAELEELARSLGHEIKAHAAGREFVEEAGVLVRRHARGGYHEVPYCPRCQQPLGSILPEMLPFACTQQCGFVSALNAPGFRRVLGRLGGE